MGRSMRCRILVRGLIQLLLNDTPYIMTLEATINVNFSKFRNSDSQYSTMNVSYMTLNAGSGIFI